MAERQLVDLELAEAMLQVGLRGMVERVVGSAGDNAPSP